MKRIVAVFAVAVLTILSFSAFIADDDPFAALLKKLEEFTKKYPSEKVYLHLDKPYYAVGDDIWFKAYVIDSKTAEPSMISGILYVDLIDERDSITKQLKLPMQSGITWGDFKLADTLKEGNYRIRAYTQLMRNYGTEFFFDKTIKIGNSWANKVFTKTTNQFSVIGNAEKVTSTIQFTTTDGKAYVNNEVSYEVQLNNKTISRGKGTTNSNGEIVVELLNNQPNLYKSGKIVATITMPDKLKLVKTIPIKTTSKNIDVQFFPEGGILIEGLPCKVGVKAINANGLGEDIVGKIIDNEGTEILSFGTTNVGMGSFFFNPVETKTYNAKVKFADGSEKLIPIPKIEKSGYLLAVNNTDTAKMTVKIMLTADLLNKGDIKLVAQHNGEVYFVSKIPTNKQVITVTPSKKEFASGIVQFTLFNTENIPVSERIAFVNNSSDKININIENLKESYDKKSKVDLSFITTNNNTPTQGSFSIAITNSSVVKPDLANESNILTNLLLTSDLVGYIEKPNYYFLNNDLKTRTDLDNLLLIQGWRKINWQQVFTDKTPVNLYQPEKITKISGKITKGGKPVANGRVSLFSSSGGFFAIDTLSNDKGEFNFDRIDFLDSTKFVVQARTDKNNKNVQIDLDIVPGQIVTANKNTGDIEVNVNETLMSYLKQSENYFEAQYKRGFLNKTITLKEVNIVAKKNPVTTSANLNGAGNADAVITAKELETAFSLSMFLSGRVAGITIRSGQAYARGNTTPMSIVLDGMNMGTEFYLDDVNVQDIETIEVLKSIGNTAIYGMNGGSGVLVITTKRGGSSNYNRFTPGIIAYSPKGYNTIRQFYSPKYDIIQDSKPDLRTTVYWNPHVVSDITGKANVNYFNTDQAGTYRIVIEGIDVNGNLARKVVAYQVK